MYSQNSLLNEAEELLHCIRCLNRIQAYQPTRLKRVTRNAYLRYLRRFSLTTINRFPSGAGRLSALPVGVLGQGGI